jgi:hypothetical protein
MTQAVSRRLLTTGMRVNSQVNWRKGGVTRGSQLSRVLSRVCSDVRVNPGELAGSESAWEQRSGETLRLRNFRLHVRVNCS